MTRLLTRRQESPPESDVTRKKKPKRDTPSKGKKKNLPQISREEESSPKPRVRKKSPGRPALFAEAEVGQREGERVLKTRRDYSEAKRDISPLDTSTIDWDRRLACQFDLERFGRTYCPKVIYLSISEDHKRCIRKMETVFLHGGMFALAMPRGGGKTAWCRIGMLWGTAYAHRRFPFFIGPLEDKAQQTLDFLKTYWYRSRALRDDFPEVGYPIYRLENRFHLARGQTFRGESTHIEWSADTLRYPCLLLSEEESLLYRDHSPGFVQYLQEYQAWVAKSAGIVIRTVGIEGSIRGEAEVHPITLEQPRPDCVLLDDIQKDQRADSPSCCEKLVRRIDGAIQGLSGPDELMACLMPCTVAREGDVSDTYLDRAKKPEWKGERCSMVTSWPEGIDDQNITMDTEAGKDWNRYSELRRESLQRFEDIHLATEYYLSHREIMDHGFTVSWVDRYNGKESYAGNREVSAQQHAMNLRLQAPQSFLSEYQNRPRSLTGDIVPIITPGELAERIIPGLARGSVPADAQYLTAFIDPQEEIYFWLVLACDLHYTGAVVDYGTWPPITSAYFRKNQTEGWNLVSREFFRQYPELKAKAEATAGGKLRAPFEAKIYFGLGKTVQYLLSREFGRRDLDGSIKRISKLGIDSRWGKASDAIKRYCRECGRQEVVPCYGQAVSPAYKQYEEYERTKGWLFEDQVNPTVREVKWILRPGKDGQFYLSMDVNRLKTFLFSRLASPPGSPGGIFLFEATPAEHQMFSDHVAGSEYPEPVTARGRTKDQWKSRDGRPDNDELDCFVGALALQSLLGVSLRTMESPSPSPKPRRKLSDIWRAKREGKS